MTREEFIEKYSDIKVSFLEYYKYVFTYEGTLPSGMTIRIQRGGNSDDIYRYSVAVGVWERVADLYPVAGHIYNGSSLVEGFDDY